MTKPLLIAELRRDEGLKLFAYDDATGKNIVKFSTVVGHPSIGIGRALDVHGITEAEAEYLCSNDIDAITAALVKNYAWFPWLDDVRQRVVANMAFNLGVAGLDTFHQTLDFIGRHQFGLASKAMENSAWYRETGERAKRLAQMIATGRA
jgi:lysozyme